MKPNYTKADWSQTNTAISTLMGVTPQAVGAARLRLTGQRAPRGGLRPGSGRTSAERLDSPLYVRCSRAERARITAWAASKAPLSEARAVTGALLECCEREGF
jgi:hypothetical protein